MTKINGSGKNRENVFPEKEVKSTSSELTKTSVATHRVATQGEAAPVTATSKSKITGTKEHQKQARQAFAMSFDQISLRRASAPDTYPALKIAHEQNEWDLSQLQNSYQKLRQTSLKGLVPVRFSPSYEEEIANCNAALTKVTNSSDEHLLKKHIELLRNANDSSKTLHNAKEFFSHEEKIKLKFNHFSIEVGHELKKLSKNQSIYKESKRLQDALRDNDFTTILNFAQKLQKTADIPESLNKCVNSIVNYCLAQEVGNHWVQMRLASDDVMLFGKDARDQPSFATKRSSSLLHDKLQQSFKDRLSTIPAEAENFVKSIAMALAGRLQIADTIELARMAETLPLKARAEYLLTHFKQSLSENERNQLQECVYALDALSCEMKVRALLSNNQFDQALRLLQSPEFHIVHFQNHLGPLLAVTEYMGRTIQNSEQRGKACLNMARAFLGISITRNKDTAVQQLKDWHQQLNAKMDKKVLHDSATIAKKMSDTLLEFALPHLPNFSAYKTLVQTYATQLNLQPIHESQMVKNMVQTIHQHEKALKIYDKVAEENETDYLLSDVFERQNLIMRSALKADVALKQEKTKRETTYQEAMDAFDEEQNRQNTIVQALKEINDPNARKRLFSQLDPSLRSEYIAEINKTKVRLKINGDAIESMKSLIQQFKSRGQDASIQWELPKSLIEHQATLNDFLYSKDEFSKKVKNLEEFSKTRQNAQAQLNKNLIYMENFDALPKWLEKRRDVATVIDLKRAAEKATKARNAYSDEAKKCQKKIDDVRIAIENEQFFYSDSFYTNSNSLQALERRVTNEIKILEEEEERKKEQGTLTLKKKYEIHSDIKKLEFEKKIIETAKPTNYFDGGNTIERPTGVIVLETLRCFCPERIGKDGSGLSYDDKGIPTTSDTPNSIASFIDSPDT